MKPLSPVDIGYLAALFDGEGTIGAYKDKRSNSFTENVGVTNTNTALLEWCKLITGFGYVTPLGDRKSEKHKKGFIWRLRRDELPVLLPILLPHLKLKRRQAELVLELLDTLKVEKIAYGRGRGTMVSEEVAILRAVICSELADLNRKGPT